MEENPYYFLPLLTPDLFPNTESKEASKLKEILRKSINSGRLNTKVMNEIICTLEFTSGYLNNFLKDVPKSTNKRVTKRTSRPKAPSFKKSAQKKIVNPESSSSSGTEEDLLAILANES